MADLTLTKLRIAGGTWTGRLTASAPVGERPELEASHLDQPVPGVSVVAEPGAGQAWTVTVPVPLAALAEGVQTVLIREAGAAEPLASFTIVTGAPLEDDIRAELDLLRAELDLLKTAFRRHCAESAG
ncbi:hypothetical protein [Acidimangrovimonas pyrenivorans]|uniref:Uncharacterized protein n=1 Tax=Acidimangrovimonas pyrenivorans TaxID=2030798 RepID=A0ABV7AD26_9RHOB